MYFLRGSNTTSPDDMSLFSLSLFHGSPQTSNPQTPPTSTTVDARSPCKQSTPTDTTIALSSPGSDQNQNGHTPDSGIVAGSAYQSSFSSNDSSSFSPGEKTQDGQDENGPSRKRSRSLSEVNPNPISVPASTQGNNQLSMPASLSTSAYNYSTGVYTTSNSASFVTPRQRFYSVPVMKGTEPLCHAPTMASKPSPTANHFAGQAGSYRQMRCPPSYCAPYHQGYTNYTGYNSTHSLAPQSAYPPTYNSYPSATVAASPYLTQSGPPGSSLYNTYLGTRSSPTYPGQHQQSSSSVMGLMSSYSNNFTSPTTCQQQQIQQYPASSNNHNSLCSAYPNQSYSSSSSNNYSTSANTTTASNQPILTANSAMSTTPNIPDLVPITSPSLPSSDEAPADMITSVAAPPTASLPISNTIHGITGTTAMSGSPPPPLVVTSTNPHTDITMNSDSMMKEVPTLTESSTKGSDNITSDVFSGAGDESLTGETAATKEVHYYSKR